MVFDAVLQKLEQQIVITLGVDQNDGPQKLSQPLERDCLEQFLKSAAAAGQGNDGIAVCEHARLALAHVSHHFKPVQALMSALNLLQKLRNDAGDPRSEEH